MVARHVVPGKAVIRNPCRRVRYEVLPLSHKRERRPDRDYSVIATITPFPTGRGPAGYFPRHFVPGYDRSVPPGRSPTIPFGTQPMNQKQILTIGEQHKGRKIHILASFIPKKICVIRLR
jgi:hypothetical protein